MVISKYRDGGGNLVEAIRFNRTAWNKIRHFTGNQAHSLLIPSCSHEQASFSINIDDNHLVVFEGEWIVKNDLGEIRIYSGSDFLKIYKSINHA